MIPNIFQTIYGHGRREESMNLFEFGISGVNDNDLVKSLSHYAEYCIHLWSTCKFCPPNSPSHIENFAQLLGKEIHQVAHYE